MQRSNNRTLPDLESRKIPVMADRYTFRRFKENGKAILIFYRYGDSYMFELMRVKDK